MEPITIKDDAYRQRKSHEARAAHKRGLLKALKYACGAFAFWVGFSSVSMFVPPQRILRPGQWAEFSKFKDRCDKDAYVDGEMRTTVDHLCAEEVYRERVLRSLEEQEGKVSFLRRWQETILFQTVPMLEEKSYSRVDLNETTSNERNGKRIQENDQKRRGSAKVF